MSKCLLHVSKLDELKEWLTMNNVPHREPRGSYQVIQIKLSDGNWACIYDRHDMKEHFTVDRRLVGLVSKAIREMRVQQ